MGIKQIILIQSPVETLEYFSTQLGTALKKRGISVWYWNMRKPLESREALPGIVERYGKGETYLLTFNFIGLSGESQFAFGELQTIWQKFQIPCYTILVDHPLYYYKPFLHNKGACTIICIDRDHRRFVKQYYPDYGQVHFLPLAGTSLNRPKEYQNRKIDVFFAGNYSPLENLEAALEGLDEESRTFCQDVARELIAYPERTVGQQLQERLFREFPTITNRELLACMYSMSYVDMYVRSYSRRELVCGLAERGVCVHVIGKDWEKAGCTSPENLICLGQMNSEQCLTYMSDAKIALNMLPWFWDGAHDRIFNGMLQGCVAVTDASKYLDEVLREGIDYVGYRRNDVEDLRDRVTSLLDNPKKAEEIAVSGYEIARKNHTWENRADFILNRILL